jgi:hypothetical protein
MVLSSCLFFVVAVRYKRKAAPDTGTALFGM